MAGASATVGPCLRADPSMPRVSGKLNVIKKDRLQKDYGGFLCAAFELLLLSFIWTNLAGSVSLDTRIGAR